MKHFQFHKTLFQFHESLFQFHESLYLLRKNGCKQASFICQLGKGNYIFYISNEFRKEFEKFVFETHADTPFPCMNSNLPCGIIPIRRAA